MNDKWFDKKLQDLSQNAADHNPIPFNNEAWSKMELLLDKEEKKRRFIAWWWLLPAILAIAVGGYFLYNGSTDKSITTLTSNTLNKTSKENNTITSSTDNIKLNNTTTAIPAKDKEPGVTDKSTASLTGETKVLEEKAPKKTGRKSDTNNDVNHSGDAVAVTAKATPFEHAAKVSKHTSAQKANIKNKIGSSDNNGRGSIALISKSSKPNAEVQLKGNASVDKDNSKTQVSNGDINNNTLGDKNVTAVNKTDTSVTAQFEITEMKIIDKGKETVIISKKENEAELKQPDSASQTSIADSGKKTIVKEVKGKESFLSKFELSALVSGDLSTVKFHNIDKISSAYGFGLSYAVSKKLSISTGFAVSRKLYLADSTNYSYVSANPMWKLSTVNANCLVYEVPLNIQYQLKEKGKNSWYAVAGLSSYFMKNEAYNYNLRYYNQTKVYDSTVVNQNNHLFGVLNLAVAYRRQFSKRWSYQLMPFVKVPLTGIGMGKAALYSAGLQLSVNLKGK